MYIYIHIHTYTFIYVYIYIERGGIHIWIYEVYLFLTSYQLI